MYWNFYHTTWNLRTVESHHTLYSALWYFAASGGSSSFCSIAVESKTKWSAQEKTHSQELAMCLTVNSVFQLLDPLEGKVYLFFSFLSFLWGGIICYQNMEHELHLLQAHETSSLESQNLTGNENVLPLSGILVLPIFICKVEQ